MTRDEPSLAQKWAVLVVPADPAMTFRYFQYGHLVRTEGLEEWNLWHARS
ncbi:hypothetical protein ACFVKB_38745 [Rhodococcus sp. NPDC127530]